MYPLKPIVEEEVYVIMDTFRTRGRKRRKEKFTDYPLEKGLAWVFENGIIWGGTLREMIAFTRNKRLQVMLGDLVGPVIMMIPVDWCRILYSFTAGDPKIERRRNIREYDRRHGVSSRMRSKMRRPLEKFKGSKPPKVEERGSRVRRRIEREKKEIEIHEQTRRGP